MMTNPPTLRFFWEWHGASPFQANDDAAYRMFGFGEIDPAKLGLPDELIEKLESTSAWHDTSLNWSYPPDPGPWRQEECDRFNAASSALFERCQRLLGGKFNLVYAQRRVEEDPDLDAYLASPASFRRRQSDTLGSN